MHSPPELETLLGHTHWLRALALQVVGDADAAEDVLQETWLAVLRNPPREASDENGLRAWLARVTRNIALRALRSSARRRAREVRGARRETQESDAGPVVHPFDCAFWQRELMDAVMALDEPQRVVVVLRYLEGLQPEEIARSLGVSGTAVRSRLNRALTSLRLQLERKHGKKNADWTSALILLAAPPRGSGPALGALLMKAQAKVAVVLFVIASVIGVGWLVDTSTEEPAEALAHDRAELVEPSAQELVDAVLPARDERRSEAPVERADRDVAADRVAPPVVEIGGVVRDTEGQPVPGVSVVFGGAGDAPLAAGRTDAAGAFRMPFPARSGRLTVRDSERYVLLFDEVIGEDLPTRELSIIVAARRDYAGIVVDADGQPVPGARLRIEMDDGTLRGLRLGVQRTTTPGWLGKSGPDGSFEFESVGWSPGLHIVARSAGFELVELELPRSASSGLLVQFPSIAHGAGGIEGIVVDAKEEPVRAATVFFGQQVAQTAHDGRFHLEGPERMAGTLIALARGKLPGELELGADGRPVNGAAEIVIRLAGDPPSIRGTVVDAQGEPLHLAKVWTSDGRPLGVRLEKRSISTFEDLLGDAGDATRSSRHQYTAADGSFELTGLLPQAIYELHSLHPATLELLSAEVSAGTEDFVFRFQDSESMRRVAGHVLSSGGAPIEGVHVLRWRVGVGAQGDVRTPWALEPVVATDADGFFEFERLCTEGVHLYPSSQHTRGKIFELAAFDDIENIEIRLPSRCSFQVLLERDPLEADAFKILDADGGTMRYTIQYGKTAEGSYVSSSGSGPAGLADGKSEVVQVDDTARTIVLYLQGVEVRRVPIELEPNGVKLIRL
ncbi:MAG: sigma-70 family RNA polymerase sigma factor [bacterium]|nr:sigma-70 family RNA polymerase sigma factor [bacterium]